MGRSETAIVQLVSKMVSINYLFDDEFLRDLMFWASRVHGATFPALREKYDVAIYDGIVEHIAPQLANESEHATRGETLELAGRRSGAHYGGATARRRLGTARARLWAPPTGYSVDLVQVWL